MVISLIVILVLGVIIGFAFAAKYIEPSKDKGSLEQAREATAEQRRDNKKKILELFGQKEQVSNDDVQKRLGVSDATATRYLEELEAEGFVGQSGKTGRSVYYVKRLK